MRQKIAKNDQPARAARKLAYRLVGLQVLMTLVIAVCWSTRGGREMQSALWGGLACVLPSFYFARRLFVTTSARAAKKIIRAFYLGEIVKLALSAGLMLVAMSLLPVSIVPLITGFVGAQFGFWFAPVLARLDVVRNNL